MAKQCHCYPEKLVGLFVVATSFVLQLAFLFWLLGVRSWPGVTPAPIDRLFDWF